MGICARINSSHSPPSRRARQAAQVRPSTHIAAATAPCWRRRLAPAGPRPAAEIRCRSAARPPQAAPVPRRARAGVQRVGWAGPHRFCCALRPEAPLSTQWQLQLTLAVGFVILHPFVFIDPTLLGVLLLPATALAYSTATFARPRTPALLPMASKPASFSPELRASSHPSPARMQRSIRVLSRARDKSCSPPECASGLELTARQVRAASLLHAR